MKTAIIIHGYNDKSEYLDESRPAASNDHWLPWLQRQLLLKGIEAQTPEMPGFYKPSYKEWKTMLERFNLDEDTLLVGHSCGGGFIVRYLSENNIKVGKVVLVAPWLDPDKNLDTGIFDFKIDEDIVLKTNGITIFNSTNDHETVHSSVAMIKDKVKDIKVVEFKDYGHFCYNDMKTDQFPELLQEFIT